MTVTKWIVVGAVVLLAVRWAWVWSANRRYNRALEYRIRNRMDIHRIPGDNE